MKRRKTILIAVPTLLALALFAWDVIGTKEVSRRWEQPESVDYGLDWQLVLEVYGNRTPLQFWDLDNIFTVHIGGNSYGHWKEYDLIEGRPDYQAYLDQCEVHWETNGVRFVEPWGYELVIPRKVFERWR